MSDEETIHVGELSDTGERLELPVVDILTGRGFLTGKSGAGKSNTASVVLEELLDAGYPAMIVDTDGEYYGLKEEYELLHAGADEQCDIQVGPEHAEKLAGLALEENVPIILDVSGYLDEQEASDLLRETARHLFAKEKKLKKPFLLVVEECHEYIPEGGGMDETGKMLIKVGKRGRKHGLGIVGVSQRPADVKKDFITQANWLVWHRLTWENDTKVVGRIVGDEYGDAVTDLDDGEAFVMTDWAEADVQTVQFRRKNTFDAGATPGLEDFERPDLKSVSGDLMDDLESITDREAEREDRVAELEREVQEKEAEIEDLEDELENARDVSDAARQMAAALSGDAEIDRSDLEQRVMEKDNEINRLRSEVTKLEAERDELETRVETLETALEEEDGVEEVLIGDDAAARIDEVETELAAREADLAEAKAEIADLEAAVADREATIEELEDTVAELEAEIEQLEAAPAAAEVEDEPAETDEETDADATDDPIEIAPDAVAESTSGPPERDIDDAAAGDAPEADTPDGDAELIESAAVDWETAPTPAGEADDDAVASAVDEEPGGDGASERAVETDPEGDVDPEDPLADSDHPAYDPDVALQPGDGGVEFVDDDGAAEGDVVDATRVSLTDLLRADAVAERIDMAYREAQCRRETVDVAVDTLATSEPMTSKDLAQAVGATLPAVQSLLTELRRLDIVTRGDDGRYRYDRTALVERVENPRRLDGLDDPDFATRID